jgi:hypothetical protein
MSDKDKYIPSKEEMTVIVKPKVSKDTLTDEQKNKVRTFEPMNDFDKEPIQYELDLSKLRSRGTEGLRLTKSLFYELCSGDNMDYRRDQAPFTIMDYDRYDVQRPSFRRLYLEIGDPTEYEQAIQLLGSVEHWKTLIEANWFRPYIDKWRMELAHKIKSETFKDIEELSRTTNSDAVRLQALKMLLTKAEDVGTPIELDKDKTKDKRGRPSKKEVEGNLKRMSKEEKAMEADYARMIETHKGFSEEDTLN